MRWLNLVTVWMVSWTWACSENNRFSRIDAVYGEDDRREVHGGPGQDQWDQAAAAVGMQIDERLILCKDEHCSIDPTSLGSLAHLQGQDFCPDVPYQDQPIPGSCTGFLVSGYPNLYFTAGHCVADQTDCEHMHFVFGMNYGSVDGSLITERSAADVYRCKTLLKRHFTGQREDPDFAVIELDRPVSGRSGLVPAEPALPIEAGQALTMIGHPLGLPAKIAFGRVRETHAAYFVTNLDAFTVNSGSPVLNGETGRLEGILVRGERDFVRDESRNCRQLRRCGEESCRGEDVQRWDTISQ